MTLRKEWFHKYEPILGGSVFMGNDHDLEIASIGTIKIKMHDGIYGSHYLIKALDLHSKYVIEINIAYCFLTEDGEPSTFHEATKS